MILGTVITLGGLAYTVVYSVNYYAAIGKYESKWWYLGALVAYNACVITVLALRHPCYSFLDVGITALITNLLFVFSTELKNAQTPQVLEIVLRTTLFLAFVALAANLVNCVDDCCR